MSAIEESKALLDERGVEYELDAHGVPQWRVDGSTAYVQEMGVGLGCALTVYPVTPERAVDMTLGRKPWVNPAWERWHRSLRHDEIKSVGDAVEQLMYEAIEFGGDMGPNGNTYNGIDEGDVLTAGFINEWVTRFESTLGRGECHNVEEYPLIWSFTCSECGVHSITEGRGFNYCPSCGRRIEVVDE